MQIRVFLQNRGVLRIVLEVALSQIDTPAYSHKESLLSRSVAFTNYTVMEIMTALVMVGALAIIVALNILPGQFTARKNLAHTEINRLSLAIEQYRLDQKHYPTHAEGFGALPGIPPLPKDPWGHAFQYRFPGRFGAFDVYSYGSDGKLGGKGKAQDFGNWQS